MLSGLNTRNIAQDVYFQGTLSSASTVVIVGESAAVLTILPNSELLVEY
jgi:broad specificity polyphosphatase/5'/3'-nucleotidase SurE